MFSRMIVLAIMGLSAFGALAHASLPFQEVEENMLTDILIPGAKGLMERLELDPQSSINQKMHVQAAGPVFAYRVSIGGYKGATAHLGYYSDSTIVHNYQRPIQDFFRGDTDHSYWKYSYEHDYYSGD